ATLAGRAHAALATRLVGSAAGYTRPGIAIASSIRASAPKATRLGKAAARFTDVRRRADEARPAQVRATTRRSRDSAGGSSVQAGVPAARIQAGVSCPRVQSAR